MTILQNLKATIKREYKYIEFGLGNIPLIIAAPHGGDVKPYNIPTRTTGIILKDTNSLELAKGIIYVFQNKFGASPFFQWNHLHRSKLDVNRNMEEGAGTNRTAQDVWKAWHGSLDAMIKTVLNFYPFCLYIDIHTHSDTQNLYLGYDIEREHFMESDLTPYVNKSSIQYICSHVGANSIVRGEDSLGHQLQTGLNALGIKSLVQPSDTVKFKLDAEYRHGAYDIDVHHNLRCDAIQIETPISIFRNQTISVKYAELLSQCLYDQFIFYENTVFPNFRNTEARPVTYPNSLGMESDGSLSGNLNEPKEEPQNPEN